MRTLAIIPARGNSKQIEKKNLKVFSGQPLLYWTIKAAQKAESITDICVSTENSDIENYANKLGVEVLVRPPCLSMDNVQVDEVCLFTLRQWMFSYVVPDFVVILQPTSPLRTADDIDKAFGLTEYEGSVLSGFQSQRYNYINLAIQPDSEYTKNSSLFYESKPKFKLEPIDHDPTIRTGRQWRDDDNGYIFVENGAIYIVQTDLYLEHRYFRVSPYRGFLMSEERSVELDSITHWNVGELLCKEGEILCKEPKS